VVGLQVFDHVTSVAQSACLHDVDDTRVVELLIELEIVSLQLVLLPSGQHPGLAAIQQYRAYQGLCR
jgi:hypothetical protein